MNIDLIKKWKKEIAVVLQMEQYKEIEEIDEELLAQIIENLEDSETKIDDYIEELSKPPKYANLGPFIV
ncbi:hypothetical protein [Proteiniphilum sp.]|uniref:hypothetical protein n=1 Tax=Proteiniphilum sp. TaxID=1926877 RepID=UPI002B20690D|nr:hypothetical protein [Proteiniphilum sp.]MEA4918112.1 hypothetical protein [Proteiniphilum sp.]